MDGGNYSCHSSDGQYLNHTVIFVHVETEKVILREISPEEGRFRKDECVTGVCLCAGLVLKAPLLLQGTSSALCPTTAARFAVPGREQPPDPTPLFSYSTQHGGTFILLFSHTWCHRNDVLNKATDSAAGTAGRFPVSWMLMDQAFSVRKTTARTKRNSTASSSPPTYAVTTAWKPTQRPSTSRTLVSSCI